LWIEDLDNVGKVDCCEERILSKFMVYISSAVDSCVSWISKEWWIRDATLSEEFDRPIIAHSLSPRTTSMVSFLLSHRDHSPLL
jgi:hypothetical protein